VANKLKYVLLGVLIGALSFGSIAAAGQGFWLDTFNVRYVIDGLEKQGSDRDQQFFNGQYYVPLAFTYNGTTYVPLRFVTESVGKEVSYDGNSATIYIGQVPDKQAQYMTDLMEPYYTTTGIKVEKGSVKMAGKTYYNSYSFLQGYLGKSRDDPKKQTASFNLGGKHSNISGLIGLEDYDFNYKNLESRIDFIGDGRLLKSYYLNIGDMPQNLDINISGVVKLDIISYTNFENLVYDKYKFDIAEVLIK
jgi:hypothetical protein